MNKKELLKQPYNASLVEKQSIHNPPHRVSENKPPFSIIMPPPNVTGALHMGHALCNTIQDILIRYHRMKGFDVLWVPGTDHSGIATQSVVEKKLYKETGKRRCDFSRKEFLSHTEEWTNIHKHKITEQIKKLGCATNWEKEKFTLDKSSSNAVLTLFKKMYDDGLIYRGDYLVNWDTHLETAIADDEVEHEEKTGHLWYFSYPVDGGETITIATTRPETILGDVAVAVHPSDDRYVHLIGKEITLPITSRKIPIIADHYVEKEFGTGAVKITPAHDFNDYEIGLRHDLPMINILHPNGTLNENGGIFANMTVQEARANIVETLKNLSLLVKVEPHQHRVGVSYRSKTVIEPLLSKQWFVKMEPFKEKLLAAVFEGGVEIIPKEWEKTYKHWIENLKDWCISRQLWWGHRIPIWYEKDNPQNHYCVIDDNFPEKIKNNPEKYIQDDDVLDTWFSSGLWPLTCLGYPNISEEMKKFYPTSVLVTGHDLLFFWVARMILMGEYAGNAVPFKQVFMHGLIFGKSYFRKTKEGHIQYLDRAEWMRYEKGEKPPKDVLFKWEKMSKSKGNVIDPLEIIDEYGTCALRLALTSLTSTSKQIDLDFRKFEESKNFINKIWNGSSFIIHNIFSDMESTFEENTLKTEDLWILSKYSEMIEKTSISVEKYQLQNLCQSIYTFFWDDFCAYYLEICKPYLYHKVGNKTDVQNKKWILFSILVGTLKCLHPIAPYVTEELFSILKDASKDISYPTHLLGKELKDTFIKDSISETLYPYFTFHNKEAVKTFHHLQTIIHSIRNISQETNMPLSEKLDIVIEEPSPILKNHTDILGSLIKISTIKFEPTNLVTETVAIAKVDKVNIAVIIPQSLLVKEKNRLEKNLEKVKANLERVEKQLSNKQFTEKAPKALIKEKQALLKSLLTSKETLEDKISGYSK